MTSLVASPAWLVSPQQGPADLGDQYAEVQKKVDAWAEQKSLYRRECSNYMPTPLCKSYESKSLLVTVELNPKSNDVDIHIIDGTGGSQLGELRRSLQATVTSGGRWSVRDRHSRQ